MNKINFNYLNEAWKRGTFTSFQRFRPEIPYFPGIFDFSGLSLSIALGRKEVKTILLVIKSTFSIDQQSF